ncbi:MAG: helix-turn-helix domain-containing protein [Nitrospiraceae bacterium]
MEEQDRRIHAIRRFLQGEGVSTICRAVGRSRRWFYYWLRRYAADNPTWAQTQSRAPHRRPTKTSARLEALICAVRQRLVATKYAQKGAFAIQWQLQQLGVEPVPAIWTINRILRRHGLLVKPRYQPRGKPYPAVGVQGPNHVHQLDLVGPRYLHGGSRFYGVHLIDAYSNAVALAAVPSKRDIDVVEAVVAAWQRLGLPRVLQVDNELSFRGSNRYPRSFGLLIRLCLYLGVEVIFIPDEEPWRSGIVERFNDVYDKLFLRSQSFRDVAHVATELPHFETFHNTQHRYAKLGQRTPWEVHTSGRRRLLPRRFRLHRRGLPWRDGRVSFIRLTDKAGTARFFSERFVVDPTLVHEYVMGTIYTRAGLLKFTHQGRIVKVHRYAVTKIANRV